MMMLNEANGIIIKVFECVGVCEIIERLKFDGVCWICEIMERLKLLRNTVVKLINAKLGEDCQVGTVWLDVCWVSEIIERLKFDDVCWVHEIIERLNFDDVCWTFQEKFPSKNTASRSHTPSVHSCEEEHGATEVNGQSETVTISNVGDNTSAHGDECVDMGMTNGHSQSPPTKTNGACFPHYKNQEVSY